MLLDGLLHQGGGRVRQFGVRITGVELHHVAASAIALLVDRLVAHTPGIGSVAIVAGQHLHAVRALDARGVGVDGMVEMQAGGFHGFAQRLFLEHQPGLRADGHPWCEAGVVISKVSDGRQGDAFKTVGFGVAGHTIAWVFGDEAIRAIVLTVAIVAIQRGVVHVCPADITGGMAADVVVATATTGVLRADKGCGMALRAIVHEEGMGLARRAGCPRALGRHAGLTHWITNGGHQSADDRPSQEQGEHTEPQPDRPFAR